MEMSDFIARRAFWDDLAQGCAQRAPIVFSDPFDVALFKQYVQPDTPILDFGCGYGRLLSLLHKHHFTQLYSWRFKIRCYIISKSAFINFAMLLACCSILLKKLMQAKRNAFTSS